MVLGYQVWLALAWKLSGLSRSLGDGMTRWMARQLRHKGQRNLVGAHMNYPYAMRWFSASTRALSRANAGNAAETHEANSRHATARRWRNGIGMVIGKCGE